MATTNVGNQGEDGEGSRNIGGDGGDAETENALEDNNTGGDGSAYINTDINILEKIITDSGKNSSDGEIILFSENQ